MIGSKIAPQEGDECSLEMNHAHFCAAHGAERTLLELAFELEQAKPWKRIQDAPFTMRS
jgi:hypothetical protein